jgi:hypothetical protein
VGSAFDRFGWAGGDLREEVRSPFPSVGGGSKWCWWCWWEVASSPLPGVGGGRTVPRTWMNSTGICGGEGTGGGGGGGGGGSEKWCWWWVFGGGGAGGGGERGCWWCVLLANIQHWLLCDRCSIPSRSQRRCSIACVGGGCHVPQPE